MCHFFPLFWAISLNKHGIDRNTLFGFALACKTRIVNFWMLLAYRICIFHTKKNEFCGVFFPGHANKVCTHFLFTKLAGRLPSHTLEFETEKEKTAKTYQIQWPLRNENKNQFNSNTNVYWFSKIRFYCVSCWKMFDNVYVVRSVFDVCIY